MPRRMRRGIRREHLMGILATAIRRGQHPLQRWLACRNAPSHECGPNGMPCSFSHSHSGSGPLAPSVNSSIRSGTVS